MLANPKDWMSISSAFGEQLRLCNGKSDRYYLTGGYAATHRTERRFSGRKEEFDGSSANDRFTD